MAAGQAGGRVRKHVIFAGRVQGVFFRATSHEIATEHGIAGYVRNLPDGTVEMEAEGASEPVNATLDAITDHFRANITDLKLRDIPPLGEATFEIRR